MIESNYESSEAGAAGFVEVESESVVVVTVVVASAPSVTDLVGETGGDAAGDAVPEPVPEPAAPDLADFFFFFFSISNADWKKAFGSAVSCSMISRSISCCFFSSSLSSSLSISRVSTFSGSLLLVFASDGFTPPPPLPDFTSDLESDFTSLDFLLLDLVSDLE